MSAAADFMAKKEMTIETVAAMTQRGLAYVETRFGVEIKAVKSEVADLRGEVTELRKATLEGFQDLHQELKQFGSRFDAWQVREQVEVGG